MTELEKRASRMKWDPPPPGSDERKEMPASAFLSPSTRTFPYKVKIDGQWVISEKGLRSAISVANFRGNSLISIRASQLLDKLTADDEASHSDNVEDIIQHFGVKGMRWGVRKKPDNVERATRQNKEVGRELKKAKKEFKKATKTWEKSGEKWGTSERKVVEKAEKKYRELQLKSIHTSAWAKQQKMGQKMQVDINKGKKSADDILKKYGYQTIEEAEKYTGIKFK